MSKPLELFALVQKLTPEANAPIVQIIRTYEDKERARQDMELINEINPDTLLDILTIPHID